MKLFVGNLALNTTSEEIRGLFSPFGAISSVEVVMDRRTGESKGFGFVEMQAKAEARRAVAALDLKELNGRCMTVNAARPEGARRSGRR